MTYSNEPGEDIDIARLSGNAQRRILTAISLVGVFLIAPFGVLRFLQGNYTMALVDSMVVIGAILAVVHAWKTRSTRAPGIYLTILCAIVGIVATQNLGIAGLMWLYPLLIFFFFMVPTRMAVIAVILVLGCTIFLATRAHYPIFESHGERLSYIVTCIMVAAQAAIFAVITRRQRVALLHSATRDSLTGAMNRTLMNDELKRAIGAFERHGETSSILALDLDHFKKINDNFGHDAGDKVLIDFVKVVERGLRLEDQFFRQGGEEFLLLIRRSDSAAMQRVSTLIHERVAAQLNSPGGPVTVSIGGAQLVAGESPEQWLRRADKNLYAAKMAGRSNSVLE